MIYVNNGDGSLSFVAKLDAAIQKEAETMSAMAKFRSMDKHALGASSSKSVTTHLNTIKYVHFSLSVFLFPCIYEQWRSVRVFKVFTEYLPFSEKIRNCNVTCH